MARMSIDIAPSQAKREGQRHKCAACAWNAGYEAGLKAAQQAADRNKGQGGKPT
jgi:hypothetical protein